MSGFFAILWQDGAEIDERLLQKVADDMRFRGPDGVAVWSGEGLAGCFALMRTGPGAQTESQPVEACGRFQFCGDIRLDGREQPQRQLDEAGRGLAMDSPSEEYFLRAWQKWSVGALEKVIGDFSLALWDAHERTLWCVLRQRYVTCMHASGVELQGHGVLFSGVAGYGKSTTAAASALRGVPVLVDDIVPLELTEEEIWVAPGYPRIWLWPELVEKLVGEAEALPKIAPDWEKRFLALDGVRGKFAREEQRLGSIYVFGERSGNPDAPRIEEVSARDALELVQKTYMNWLLDRERRAKEFDELWKVVQQVPVRRIFAHEDPGRIGELCELILADVAKVLGRVNV